MSAPMQRRASTLLSKCGSFPGNIRIENFSKELVGVSRLFSYRARQEKVDVVGEKLVKCQNIAGLFLCVKIKSHSLFTGVKT